MSNLNNTQDTLCEILRKCEDETSSIERSLVEGLTSNLIIEALTEEDVDEVKRAITMGRNQLETLDSYIESMSVEMKEVSDYSSALMKSLDQAQIELAKANFDTGAMSKFLGQNITLPQITKAAIALYTKASEFTNGYIDAINNIQSNILPLVKNFENEDTLRSQAGKPPLPAPAELEKLISKAMTKSLGGDMFGKLKSFFGKALTGAEAKVMNSLPKVDLSILGTQIANKLMDAKISDLKIEAPKKETKVQKDLEDNVKKATDLAPDSVAAAEENKEVAADDSSKEPQSPAETIDDQTSSLASAIEAESKTSQTPGDAIKDAMNTWVDGLSKSSQASLKTKNRLGELQDLIDTALEDASKAVESEISTAIDIWREEHEETLIRSKRFAKKNFDSLQKMIPQLASFMIKKVNENAGSISRNKIKEYTQKILDKKFNIKKSKTLTESYSVESMIVYRMNRLAGLDT